MTQNFLKAKNLTLYFLKPLDRLTDISATPDAVDSALPKKEIYSFCALVEHDPKYYRDIGLSQRKPGEKCFYSGTILVYQFIHLKTELK
ncbi:MAG: hypothetical protein ACP5O2_10530 [Bacteroidales bacterium]